MCYKHSLGFCPSNFTFGDLFFFLVYALTLDSICSQLLTKTAAPTEAINVGVCKKREERRMQRVC